MSGKNSLDECFAAVMRSAESRSGMLIPPDLEAMCRFAFFTGAVEAAAMIECRGATPNEIAAQYRAAFPNDHKRGL